MQNEKYFLFLDEVRASGKVNMWGAAPILRDKFKSLSREKATELLGEWMTTFSERHYKAKA